MKYVHALASAIALTIAGGAASASTISFADTVVDYTQGLSGGATIRNDDPNSALGATNYVRGVSGTYVSLGFRGSLTVEFSNSVFSGSGSAADDLFITEIGVESEGTIVEISANGVDFFEVGTSGVGNDYGIDIDAFGFGVGDVFSFVRVTDDGIGGRSGEFAGADIDSIAAINTIAAVPLPAAGWLLLGAFGGLAAVKRRKS